MLLHIFTKAITNKPYQSLSPTHTMLICCALYWLEYTRQAALFPINFWHHHCASALGMQGVQFIVAGLIFHPAKIILLQGLTFGGIVEYFGSVFLVFFLIYGLFLPCLQPSVQTLKAITKLSTWQ